MGAHPGAEETPAVGIESGRASADWIPLRHQAGAWLSLQRKPDRERRAFAFLAFDVHAAVVQLDELAYGVQAKTFTWYVRNVRSALVAIENSRQIASGDAYTRVADAHNRPIRRVVRLPFEYHAYLTRRGTVFPRIVQQIIQHT